MQLKLNEGVIKEWRCNQTCHISIDNLTFIYSVCVGVGVGGGDILLLAISQFRMIT